MPVVETIAAVFGSVSAITALYNVFKQWREKRKEKKCLETAKAATSFDRVPQIIRETCASCVRKAGQRFHVGDMMATSSIVRATRELTATLNAMLNLAIGGGLLDLSRVRNTVDVFGRNVVGSMGSLFARLHRTGPSVPLHSHRRTGNRDQNAEFPTWFTEAYDPIAPIPPLEDISNAAELKATLDAIQSDCSMEEYGMTLEQDLNAIAAAPLPPLQHVELEEAQPLESWNVLQNIMERRPDELEV